MPPWCPVSSAAQGPPSGEAQGRDFCMMVTVDISPLSAALHGPGERRVVGLGAQLGQSRQSGPGDSRGNSCLLMWVVSG